ncbi:unnamed protein product [Adineta ricciae]|uniref:TIR domain-containing protein n=1 Tax=Adineta ricciae TaxID=249248 RepID=A0A815SFM9_ADIRI|nr:unnamed protein product [Adineta ricciae]CAF1492277.1 unnamed protein product [Adineta ricciae]
MFHYEDERIFYCSNEDDVYTAIVMIEKGNVLPGGQACSPFPSDKIEKKALHSSTSNYVCDLMISYCRQDKDLVHMIYSTLIADGFKVWVDFENMYGSTIERMAENSHFIHVCISNRYEMSPYCKVDGQYT